MTDQCFTTSFRQGTYFETTRDGCLPSITRYDDIPSGSVTPLVQLDDILSKETCTVLLTWKNLTPKSSNQVTEEEFEVYLTFAENDTITIGGKKKGKSKKKKSIMNYVTFKTICNGDGVRPKLVS